MNKKYSKRLSGFLAFVMIFSSIFIMGLPNKSMAEGQTFVETFDKWDNNSTAYGEGNFTGNYSIQWNYKGARGNLMDQGVDYSIDGNGMILRRSGDGSKVYATIAGGIKDFSVDLKKAMTNKNERTIELFINGQSQGAFTLDNNNDDVQKFIVKDINIEGEFTLEIRHISGGSKNAQITVDNITWTSYEGQPSNKVSNVVATPKSGTVTKGTEVELSSKTEGAEIYYTIDGSQPSENSTKYETPIIINEDTNIKAIAVKEGMENSDIAEFNYTVLKILSIQEVREKADGQEVITEGIITADLGDTIYIQDETAGIAIYKKDFNKGHLKLGDKVKVNGKTNTFYGLKQIKLNSDEDIEFIQTSEVPEPKVLKSTEITNDLQGQLVKIENVFTESVDTYKIFTLRDAEGTVFGRAFDSSLLNVDYFYESITGIVIYEYDQVRLLARFPEDIVEDHTIVKPVQANPSGGKVVEGSKVELSSKTEGAEIYYTIDGSQPSENSTKYEGPIIINEDTTIKAIAIKEGLKNSIVSTFKYEVANIGEGTKISTIQGPSHRSPMENEDVVGVVGVVTGIFVDPYNNGFFIQDINPDDDYRTSEGIFIDRKKNNLDTEVSIGDMVSVNGKVVEGSFENLYSNTLTITQIQANGIEILSTGNTLPEPIVIGKNGRQVPDTIHDGNWDVFDPETKALDFYESLEGMLVEVEEPIVVGVREDYGEIVVLPDKGDCCQDRLSNHGGVLLLEGHNNPQRILISDKITPLIKDKKFIDPNFRVKVGDEFNNSVRGIMSYDFGNYKLYNTHKLPELTDGGLTRDTTKIEPREDKLTLGVYNVENFSAKSTDRLDGLVRDIVENMKAPDIVGLVEIQDNDGEGKGAGSDATETLNLIVNAIKAKSGIEYGFVNINPENNKDGGAPNANIRSPFIYKKERITLVEGEHGDATTPVGLKGEGEATSLTLNPGRIAPSDPAFESSRKPLIAEFTFGDEKIFIVNNHFASKRGDTPLFGDTQPPVRGSEKNRHKQAEIVNNFVKEIMERNPKANVVVMGDLNDFQFSETLKILKGNEMTNAIELLPIEEQHTYVHEGNSQVLDHILISNNLRDKAEADIVNINSEFIEAYGRISDHDPVVVQIDFNGEIPEEPIGDELIIRKPVIDHFKLGTTDEITIKVENGTEEDQEVTLIAGVYEVDTNRLVGGLNIVSKEISRKTIDTLTTNIVIPDQGNYVVKYFIWDSIENMKPLEDREVISVIK